MKKHSAFTLARLARAALLGMFSASRNNAIARASASKPIRMVVPFPAEDMLGLIARRVAKRLTASQSRLRYLTIDWALAAMSKQRAPVFESLPTAIETIKDLESKGWFSIHASTDMPVSTVDQVNREISKVIQGCDTATHFAEAAA